MKILLNGSAKEALAALAGDTAVVVSSGFVPTHDTWLIFLQVAGDVPRHALHRTLAVLPLSFGNIWPPFLVSLGRVAILFVGHWLYTALVWASSQTQDNRVEPLFTSLLGIHSQPLQLTAIGESQQRRAD